MISLKNVSVSFPGGVVALQPVNLELRRGEFTVLLGASGAGKSTLLRSLNYLNKPTTGNIIAEGLGDLNNRKVLHQHRQQTGMIFQQHQLIGRQTALSNVLLGRIGYHSFFRSLFPLPDAEQRIALECLERVGLLHKALERADCLSGGQQQRVGIARALAQRPKLLLADEPIASLDPTTSTKVLSLLRRICREDDITAVVSLHQVEFAKEYADRIIALSQGHIVFDSAPENLNTSTLESIYEAPKNEGGPSHPVMASPALAY